MMNEKDISDNIDKVISAVNQKLPYILLQAAVEDKTVENLMKGVELKQ